MLFRKKALLAKIEGTYGVDSTPTTTDAVLTKNLLIQPYGGNTVSRDLDRGQLGAQTQINTGPLVQLTFDVEIAGSGTAGTAPAWGDLLEACGFLGTADPGVDVVYAPVSSSYDSATLKYYNDGQEHKVLGARGNVSFSLARGAIPTMSFTFIGLYARPTAVALPAGVTTDYIAPIPVTKVNTPTFSVHGTAVVAESLAINMGNNVIYRNVIGSESVIITDRNATGQMVVEAPAIGTKNWFTSVESHDGITTGAVQLVHGTAAGNIVTFDGVAVQLTAIDHADSEGLTVYNMAAAWTPSSGDDDVIITLT
jgi:hypothetical protein